MPVWLGAARLEEAQGAVSKARSILEIARLKINSPQLWLCAVRVERRAGNHKAAATLMAKALQQCRNAGTLWAEAIAMEARPQQKAKSLDALRRCDNDPHVIVAVASLFWRDRKIEKARKWFERAVTLEPSLGDAWATYLAFEAQHGDDAKRRAEAAARAAGPTPGA